MVVLGPHELPLARQLLALADPQLRVRRLAALLRDHSPTRLMPQLHDAIQYGLVQTASHAPVLGAREVHLTLVLWLLQTRPRPGFPVGTWPLPDDGLRLEPRREVELLRAAEALELPYLGLLLRLGLRADTEDDRRLLQLHPSMDKLPLGVRRERARLGNREHLQFLLLDTTPAVVQLLANNPRVTEAHAVQIASLRPTHPWALQALLTAPRWLGAEAVLEAVARNPSTPGWLVLALAPLLPQRIQRALVHMSWLEPNVRDLLADWQALQPAGRIESLPVTHEVGADELADVLAELGLTAEPTQQDDWSDTSEALDPELAAALAEALAAAE